MTEGTEPPSIHELERTGAGRYQLRRPVDDVEEWAVGDVVAFKGQRAGVAYVLLDWTVTEPAQDRPRWRGVEEWVYTFMRVATEEEPRLLAHAGRPGWSEKGYTTRWSGKAMSGTADPGEAVPEEWQEAIARNGWDSREERQLLEQREREKGQSFVDRIEGAKRRARERGASRMIRAEIRTVEILGKGDRRRASAMLRRLEMRLWG